MHCPCSVTYNIHLDYVPPAGSAVLVSRSSQFERATGRIVGFWAQHSLMRDANPGGAKERKGSCVAGRVPAMTASTIKCAHWPYSPSLVHGLQWVRQKKLVFVFFRKNGISKILFCGLLLHIF